jgi:hypothetical protein
MGPAPGIDLDDAIHFLVSYVRTGLAARDRSRFGQGSGGAYDVRLHLVAREYLAQRGVPEHDLNGAVAAHPELGVFFTAAWDLCRRGILRPGARDFASNTTASWAGGEGFCATPYGERWIQDADELELIPMQPARFASMLLKAGARFGPGFVERADQAVACYMGRAFLACCAMSGAAAESVLLALAIAKKGGDERWILDKYAGPAGRSRVETYLLGQQTLGVREEFQRYTALLKHWRDDSAHGRAVRISEPEAYQSMAILLRFARWAEDHWDDLVNPVVKSVGE